MKKGIKAFTLVELIVVITILAILATIGFVSFSGYLAGTRDVNRTAQLKSMSDALELYRTKKDLPIPDDKIDIKAGNYVIAYQWDMWKNVLETIEYTESWLDPKYKEYFSYYLTKNKKYFQLMAFLEEENKDVLAMNNLNKLNATDYSDKYPFVKWKKLWMLTDENNTPIQKVSAIIGSWSIDTKTATWYIANVDNWKQLTWREISGLKEIAQLWWIEQNLVAWYDFETIDWTWFLDLSGNHYTWNIFGSPVVVDWKIWKALKFDWTIDNYIVLPNEILDWKKDYSISIWMNTDTNPIYSVTANTAFSVFSDVNVNELLISSRVNSSVSNITFNYDIKYPFRVSSNEYSSIENNWYHLFMSKNNNELELFINWKKTNTTSSWVINNIQIKALWIVVWQDQDNILWWFQAPDAMKWKIDDLRIYDGTMSEGRIEKIYRLGR